MAFSGILTIDGNSFTVNWMLLEISRSEDPRGKPSSRPGWQLIINLDVMDDTTIKNWMIDPHMQKDGKVVLNRTDEAATFKEIEFRKAVCVGYSDTFFADREYMSAQVVITGSELVINRTTLQV